MDAEDTARPVGDASTTTMLQHVGRGMVMGSADVVPGVSGGTMALVMGIYETLVDAIHGVAGGAVAWIRGEREEGRATLRAVPWHFVLPLGLGIVLALGLGAVILEPLLERFPVAMSALFFGLIAGAIPIPWRRMSERGPRHFAVAAVAAVAAFVIAGLGERGAAELALPLVFCVAAIAVCAMILPGVSGAFLLLVLGAYEPTLSAVRNLDVLYIGTFVAGAAIGLGSFARLLSWLLDHHHDITMAALVGLMAGSLRKLWPWTSDAGLGFGAPPGLGEAALAAALALVGAALVLGLERLGDARS